MFMHGGMKQLRIRKLDNLKIVPRRLVGRLTAWCWGVTGTVAAAAAARTSSAADAVAVRSEAELARVPLRLREGRGTGMDASGELCKLDVHDGSAAQAPHDRSGVASIRIRITFTGRSMKTALEHSTDQNNTYMHRTTSKEIMIMKKKKKKNPKLGRKERSMHVSTCMHACRSSLLEFHEELPPEQVPGTYLSIPRSRELQKLEKNKQKRTQG